MRTYHRSQWAHRMVAAHSLPESWQVPSTVARRARRGAIRQKRKQTTVGAACDSSGAGQDQRAEAECQVEDNDDDAQGRRADRLGGDRRGAPDPRGRAVTKQSAPPPPLTWCGVVLRWGRWPQHAAQ